MSKDNRETNESGKIKIDPAAVMKQEQKKKEQPAQVYMTEAELKVETARRMEEQRLIEAARPPKSETAKKADNFFYHYKLHMVAGVVILLFVGIFLRDVIFAIRPDFTVIAVSSRNLPADGFDTFENYFSQFVDDVNGDGRHIVRLDFISLPRDILFGEDRFEDDLAMTETQEQEEAGGLVFTDIEFEMANIMKLSAIISSNADPIMLLDEGGVLYLSRIGGIYPGEGTPPPYWQPTLYETGNLFYQLNIEGAPDSFGLPVDMLNLPPSIARNFSGMAFYLRDWSGDTSRDRYVEFEYAHAFLMRLLEQ